MNAVTFDRHEEVVSKYVDKIRILQAELKRERQVVDFYASEELYTNPENFSFGMIGSPVEIDKGQYARNQKIIRKELV
jgi:hypothetical protein